MDIQQLRTFVEVVNRGSFAAAARLFNVAPSMVTRSVAALEDELGVRLIQRTTRKLALTEAGAAYFEPLRGALDALERANDEAKAVTGDVGGALRITTSVAYGQTVVVPLLPELHRQHPGLQVELIQTDSMLDLVAERIDIALRLGPPKDTSLVGVQLASVRYRVVASEAYLQQHGRPRSLGELGSRDCLRFPWPGFRSQWSFRDRDGAAQSVAVNGWLVLSTALSLHRAALDGLGPALLADWLVQHDIESGRLVDLFPDHEATATAFDSSVWLLYPSRSYLPRRVRAVVDFFKVNV